MSLSKENKVIIDDQAYYGGLDQPNLKFIKVNVDCWEKIFDYLSLSDIISMSSTCLRMQKIGGRYFRENFHGYECNLKESSLHSDTFNDDRIELERDDFVRFIDTVRVSRDFQYLQRFSNKNLLRSLTTLCLDSVDINQNEIHGLTNVLNNIETIEIWDAKDNAMGQFLVSCPKLKCLRIGMLNFYSNSAENSIFQHVYPMLTDFQCNNFKGTSSETITSFLDRNSGIKNLRIRFEDLNKIHFEETRIRLESLSIDVYTTDIDATAFANRLKELHANGYFKTLRICETNSDYDDEIFINAMASFSALEALHIGELKANVCHLIHLKELHIQCTVTDFDNMIDCIPHFEVIAKTLINLERLWINCTIRGFLPFLRYSKKLKLAIWNNNDDGIDVDTLNLFDLNEERRMSGIKRKIQIGFFEGMYLAMKRKTKDEDDYELVKITRAETIFEQFVCRVLYH